MVALTPVFPEQLSRRPPSQSSRAFISKWHPLLSTAGQNLIRSHFTIVEWLLIGSCLQALILALAQVTRLPLVYVLTPTIGLAIFKVAKTVMVTYGMLENCHMKTVRVGRHTAVFPEEDGSFVRAPGQSVGGSGMCLIILSSKCNHPLGAFYPPYTALAGYARKMFQDLEKNASEHGFLGYSSYHGTDNLTKPIQMNLMYFKSIDHLHKFAHSKSHRDGWDWWNANVKDLDQVTIAHEVYSVPEGQWENIYQNAPIFDFAATRHEVMTSDGERKWGCPVLDAKKGFKNSVGRMGTVKN